MKALLHPVVRLAVESGSGAVESETAGPFTTRYREVGPLFAESTRSSLRALCGVEVAGVARGQFPPEGGYDTLFRRPLEFR
ncbi:hypothetical protein ACSDQ9_05795 [Aestuariimicrobium soli]|uniref:hypothetical protein n=1 Tax=Aestuariimicrobium soli TaxID=2035834 RepID=UPI003EBE25D1